MNRRDRTRLALSLAAAVLGLLAPEAVSAADPAAGKAKSTVCVACHGPKGISQVSTYPNLAGQKERYLADAMRQYKTGKRDDPIMRPLMAPLSDADIANLAAYYASMSPR